MRKLPILFALCALVIISCNNEAATTSSQTKEQSVKVQADPPPTLPVEKAYTPIEFGLTNLNIEKNEGGECGGKDNIKVTYQIYVKIDSSFSDELRVIGWDCSSEGENNGDEGKATKAEYELLKNCKVEDLTAIVVEQGDKKLLIKSLLIKEKWTAGKDGKAATVIPARVLRGF